jgi:DNA-binding transcriptional LysR family regulator
MRLTFRQLQIFVAVAQSGSTVAAAQAIALSQSATSGAINELERMLSTRLFDRIGKKLVLNEHGRALLPQALALIDGAEGLERQYEGNSHYALAGAASLRLAASTTIGNYVLPGLLASYGDMLAAGTQHKRSDILAKSRVIIANTGAVALSVSRFDVDAGFVEGPSSLPDVLAKPWLADELLIVAAPTHLAVVKRGARVTPLNVLRESRWLLREEGSGTRDAVESALVPHLHQLRIGMELGDSEAIKRATAEGLGITCLSRWVVADFLESGRLVEVKTSWPKMQRRFYLLVHANKQIAPGLKRFLDHCLT